MSVFLITKMVISVARQESPQNVWGGGGGVAGRKGQNNCLRTLETFNLVKRRLRKMIIDIEGELERSSIYLHVEGRMGHEIVGISFDWKEFRSGRRRDS